MKWSSIPEKRYKVYRKFLFLPKCKMRHTDSEWEWRWLCLVKTQKDFYKESGVNKKGGSWIETNYWLD